MPVILSLMGSTFGTLFKISTWGESHGGSVGVVIDGCPPGLPLDISDIQEELDRRKPGQSEITTPRKEPDQVEFLSGIQNGFTLGSPIAMNVRNKDARPSAYKEMQDTFRPSHADFTYEGKYGRRMVEGGGRSSARETIGRVAAGAVARKILQLAGGIEATAWVQSVMDITCPALDEIPNRNAIEANSIRCPHPETASRMIELIKQVRSDGDSVGGTINCAVSNLPVGLGAPVFDRLEADIAKAMLSIPATKGFEIGSGFSGTLLKGSQHNDPFVRQEGSIRTATNHAGGVLGGISSGEILSFKVAFKPTATILKEQQTVTKSGQPTVLKARGRHDPCVLPRAVPIVEAMTNLVIVDHWMRHHGQNLSFPFSQQST